jgi:BlaI family penicillinase repressor
MQISNAEAVVLEVLWEHAPQTMRDIHRAIASGRSWRPGTIASLLSRLLKKKAISGERQGRRFLYRPLFDRQHYVDDQTIDLVERVFDGNAAALVERVCTVGRIRRRDIAGLRKVLDDCDHPRADGA